ncbi:voltage-gated chloride channel TMC4 isoform X8 [Macaca fascicularis]|uniref:voltage-gated chloride channel TMC4 isoform X8 n=1 Tax=Macaca fascicularis TaxID=9541 RepID=UPI003D15D69A
MEENPTLESEAWGSSRGWLAPREARGGPSLSSVLNELPSAATLRYRGPGVLPWGVPEEEEEAGGRSRKAFTEVTQAELQDPHPSRELPWPMQARRAHRQRNARDQVIYGSGTRTDQWARLLRRSKEKTKEGLQSLQPWSWTLKRIGGQFGAGTESYFSLLRFLLLLNVLASVLMACMTLLPTWLGGAPPGPPGSNTSSPCGSYNPHPQGLVTFATQLFNLLSGELGVRAEADTAGGVRGSDQLQPPGVLSLELRSLRGRPRAAAPAHHLVRITGGAGGDSGAAPGCCADSGPGSQGLVGAGAAQPAGDHTPWGSLLWHLLGYREHRGAAGEVPCSAVATAEACGELPSVHLHRWGQLCAAARVQAHCSTGRLH